MTALILTGWQQSPDSLLSLIPGSTAFDYSAIGSTDEFFSRLKPAARNCEIVIGWSLGGQLALRALATGAIQPRHLFLLATPWQFIATPQCPTAMPELEFARFRKTYVNTPATALHRFTLLMGHGDSQQKNLFHNMNSDGIKIWNKGLFWLDELGRFSGDKLSLSHCSPTIRIHIIHGAADAVVNPAQAHIIKKNLGNLVEATEWPACGHAPQLHDPERLKQTIANALTSV